MYCGVVCHSNPPIPEPEWTQARFPLGPNDDVRAEAEDVAAPAAAVERIADESKIVKEFKVGVKRASATRDCVRGRRRRKTVEDLEAADQS
jgi:hypothetical protein